MPASQSNSHPPVEITMMMIMMKSFALMIVMMMMAMMILVMMMMIFTWASITQSEAVRCPPPLSPMIAIYR